MPYDERGLNALSTISGFTLWHYRTGDQRGSVIAPGYFTAAAARLAIGDVIIVQASDATAFLPVGVANTTGAGLTLDTTGAGLRLIRSATQFIEVNHGGIATARAIILAGLPPSALPETPAALTITVIGPVAQVTLSLIDENDQPAAAPQIFTVVGGLVATTITLPGPPGAEWRLRVADTADATLVTISAPTLIRAYARLLRESGGLLLLENGAVLLS
ncbi:hypothetical protein [Plastoroseomonas arctica]|uniref:Uncharacterized protein n=1 Tax=Plastoroseomonas arctica TaxID=1509237 RepID=A0AAF1JVW5_9PROT|nr:hypothetical protein [Plastoroseomonas arctica]MBR0654841.1 hypothetical protein [Plastoroseomonas arctica]